MTTYIKLIILVEGQTEEGFVKNVLAPYLLNRGIHCIIAKLITTKRNYKGGLISWGQAENNLNHLFESEKTAFISTMFDFHKFPTDIKGYPEKSTTTAVERVITIESAMKEYFPRASSKRFIPFVMLHEFEALLFSNPSMIVEHLEREPSKRTALITKLEQAGEPETINTTKETLPAARLEALVRQYGKYRKVTDGVILAGKIGIEIMLEKCPHFAAWVQKLCDLGEIEQ